MRNFIRSRPDEALAGRRAPPGPHRLLPTINDRRAWRRRSKARPLYRVGRQLEPHPMARELLLQEAAPPPPGDHR